MKATTMTLEQAARAVCMKAVQIDQRPDELMKEPAGWNGTHWKLTLTREWWEPRAGTWTNTRDTPFAVRRRRTWTVYWSQGSGFGDTPPAVADVLEALRIDAEGVRTEYGRCWGLSAHAILPFEDWAREWGYDPDSRKAEKVYKACVKAARAWAKFWDGTEIIHGDET